MTLEQIKRCEPVFLPRAKDGGYICPVCGNGSGSDGTGIHRIPGRVSFRCFVCGFSGTVIDLYGKAFGITNTREMITQCKRYFQSSDQTQMSVTDMTSKADSLKTSTDFTPYYDKLRRIPYNGEYLRKRGISKVLQDDAGILYDPEWQHPESIRKAKAHGRDLSTVPKSPRIIIPSGPNGYLARDIRAQDEMTREETKLIKQNAGTVGFYIPREIKCNRPVFVVEGQIDALSVMQACGQAIALCGAANVRRFVDEIVKRPGTIYLYLMLDMDDAGRKSQTKLAEMLDKTEIPYTALDYPYHDPNDFLMSDPGGLVRFVAECEKGRR